LMPTLLEQSGFLCDFISVLLEQSGFVYDSNANTLRPILFYQRFLILCVVKRLEYLIS